MSVRRSLRAVACLGACALVTAGPGHGATAASKSVPFQRGVTVADFGRDGYPPVATERLLRRLRARHVDTVTLLVSWKQNGARSVEVRRSPLTVRDSHIVKAIRSARRAGIRVILRPYVDRNDGGWRGQIRPVSINRWFASYRRFILHYARLARRERARGFVVGTEMVSTSGYDRRWRQLVAAVRRRFSGFITYQANWDEEERVTWWDAVDVISVSAYYEVAKSDDYTVADLLEGWREPFATLDALQARVNRPVMFGEIGYRTVRGTARQPWNTNLNGPYDETAQLRAYEAALERWYRVPFFRGFAWWYVSPKGKLRKLKGGDHQPAQPSLDAMTRYYRTAR
jgi:hypothetical protein